jgi:beta-mannosidase
MATWDRVGAVGEFCDPAGAADLIRILGTAHGEYLQQRVERERRGQPDGVPAGSRRCWGNTVWRLNDSWPMIYSSVIDYYLAPKIAYYFLRRAYQPVLVCFERTPDRICAWVVNDSAQPVAGTLVVRRLGFDGKVHGELKAEVAAQPGEAKRCLDLTEFSEVSLRSQFFRATFAGQDVTYLLIGERYLHLPPAHLTLRQSGERIEIATDVFARQVSLQAEGAEGCFFEDNFFDLAPGEKRALGVSGAAKGLRITAAALNAEPVAASWQP